MPARGFLAQVEGVAGAFGLRPQAVKDEPEGLFLRTDERIVYVFLEGTRPPSVPELKDLIARARGEGDSLVLLSPAPLTGPARELLAQAKVPEVTGERYRLLLVNLGLVPEEAGPLPPGVLPTAHQLDGIMSRARHWDSWGLPALGLRFYEQALRLKPGYTPAMVGAGNALAALGQTDRAEALFSRALQGSPDLWGARLGLARLEAARGHPRRALKGIRDLWESHRGEPVVQAHLVEALCGLGEWGEALPHIQEMVRANPRDPYLHALLSLCLEGRGERKGASHERDLADRLGMTPELWSDLRRSLPGQAFGGRRPRGGDLL
jgi:tetratricopeptide (TPR) repeat protein